MQFNFFIPKLTFMNSLFGNMVQFIMNFVSQKFRDSAVMSQMNLRSFYSIPTFFLTGLSYLFFPPATLKKSSSPIYLRPWGSTFQYFSFIHRAFWLTKRPVRSHVIYDVSWIGHTEQSQNHTMMILKIIPRATPRNAFLRLQIHLCNAKLKLSH